MVEYERFDGREPGPVLMARRAHELIQEGGDHYLSAKLASIEIEDNQFGGFQIKLMFHENEMEMPFVFRGARAKLNQFPEEMKDKVQILYNKPASHPKDLSKDIGTIADILEIAYDMPEFEFAKLDAASIGGMGQLTDYEFTYETGSNSDKLAVGDIDEAIEKSVISTWDDDDVETLFGYSIGEGE